MTNNNEEREKVAVGRIYKPTGEEIKKGFNRRWGSYTFSDEEVEMLLEGKEIKIVLETGENYLGRLAKGKYKGKEFFSFTLGIFPVTAGYEWSREERERLYRGETLHIDKFYSSKKCKNFSASAFYDPVDNKVILDIDKEEKAEDEEREEE